MYNSLIITLFCYNTDYTMDSKNSGYNEVPVYISYPMLIEPMITQVPLEFFWYMWLDTKNFVGKNIEKF